LSITSAKVSSLAILISTPSISKVAAASNLLSVGSPPAVVVNVKVVTSLVASLATSAKLIVKEALEPAAAALNGIPSLNVAVALKSSLVTILPVFASYSALAASYSA